jgi:hypothetical protein
MAIKLGAATVGAFALYYFCAAMLIGQVAAKTGEATFSTTLRKHRFMQIESKYIVIYVIQLRLQLL